MHSELAPDGVLQVIVSTVNNLEERTESGTGLVLTVKGVVISGELIPAWQWHEELEQGIRDAHVRAGQDPEHAGFAELFKLAAESTRQRRDEQRALEELDQLPQRYRDLIGQEERTQFIHLRDARVFSPGNAGLPGNGLLWRGRLSEVSGWSFGKLSTDSD